MRLKLAVGRITSASGYSSIRICKMLIFAFLSVG